LAGEPQSGPLVSNDEIKPTLTPTPTPTPLPQRLNVDILPDVAFGPPGESERESERPRLSGDPQTLDSRHFRIHYTLSGRDAVPREDSDEDGHPDFVVEVVEAMEFSWFAQIEHFGWDPPPNDADLGGDERYDVYLENILVDDYAGYAEGNEIDGLIGDNPHSAINEENTLPSYLVLDNDYAEYAEYALPGISALDYMRVTAAHELNHALQFGYDGDEPHDWLWEATATWMQDEVFDAINESTTLLEAVFKSPDTCLMAEGGEERVEDSQHWYGTWILLRYLSERYGHAAVLQLWQIAAASDGFDIWDTLLQTKGENFEDFFRDYSVALLTRNFEEGNTYPTVRLEGEARPGELFEPVDGVEQLAMDYVQLRGEGEMTATLSGSDLEGLLVGVADDQSQVFPLQDGSGVINADDFDYSYLVVLNLQRPEGVATCHALTYTVSVESGGEVTPALKSAPASNFQPPWVEGLLDPDEYFDEE
jgi:hypothetical protein